MSKELYVGNLPYQFSQEELTELFEPYGNVVSARVAMDPKTQLSRGFGFVEMETDQQAKDAIEGLKGTAVGGRNIVINEARPHTPRSFNQRSNNGHRPQGNRTYSERPHGEKHGERSHQRNSNNRRPK